MEELISATINIKPLSVNQAWRGRRFKTPEYARYQRDLSHLLPKKKIAGIDALEVHYEFGFSSRASDIDNCIKSFQDALVEQYGIDDRFIFRIVVEKFLVPKGKEYIKFKIFEYETAKSI